MRQFLKCVILMLFSLSSLAQSTTSELIREGVHLHDRGDYKGAITHYEEALRLNSTSMSATYEMSLSYLKLKDYTNALKYSTKVINANFQPLLAEAYCVKASVFEETNKPDLAIQLLLEGLNQCKDDYQLNFNLGDTYYKVHDNKNALIYLRKAIGIDATQPDVFLLYAYVLEDDGEWIQSILSFHFFLLLEPNTKRSKEAFGEMFGLMNQYLRYDSPLLYPENGVDRKHIYDQISKIQRSASDAPTQFLFFQKASHIIFYELNKDRNKSDGGFLWSFYVPVYGEILNSGYFDTYCRYVSVSYFPQSYKWWETHKQEVNNFSSWFEKGQSGDGDGGDDDEPNNVEGTNSPTQITQPSASKSAF